jgi:hypothetical protein
VSITVDALTPGLGRPATRLASDAEVLDRVHRTLGPVDVVAEHDGPHRASRVLQLVTRGQERAVAKWHRDALPHRREDTALQHHTPALSGDAPRLVLSDPALRLVVVSHVLGEQVAGTEYEHDAGVHARAGELLRRLHDSAPPVRHDRFGPIIAADFERWSALADDRWGDRGAEERHLARQHVAAALDLGALDHVPAHRQVHPRHWVIDPGGRVRFVDFSAFEFEPWAADLFWLEYGVWRDAPALRSAFLQGYGRVPSERDELALSAIAASRALELLVRGERRGHAVEKMVGRGILDRLLGTALF